MSATGPVAHLVPGALAPGPHRALGPPSADRGGHRRRPTGSAPPLPRQIGLTGKLWLGGLAVVIAWVLLAVVSEPVRTVTARGDTAVLRRIAQLRTGWMTDVMTRVDRLGSGWALTALALVTILGMVGFRRWRHLFTYLGSLAVLEIVGAMLYDGFSRPRPYGVTAIGRWAGYSLPSPPVAVLAAVLIGVAYTLVVPGRTRTAAKVVIAVLLALFIAARLYLGVDHPFDVVVAVALGVTIPLTAFRFFTPNHVFPVVYRRGKTAHLDVGGRRGEAIRCAIQEQLGMHVKEIEPFGLEGSGGSTPLKVTVAGDPDVALFAKLYAMSHVRADRWYKLGRRILYGSLEDEAPFQSVRRLAQHEDYALRLLRDHGLPTAEPYGIVEITPEREYLVVTGFFEGATEIGRAEVDDQVIDEALAVVRALWDGGLAHRDIKPANLLVQDGHVRVIDVAFVAVRPSPWRQAVDLANMMLVLAVRTDSERVYRRALQFFTPEDVAEAFAATRGVASPSQLRSVLKRDGRDLVAQFRALAPPRRPIGIQRWSVRRVLLAFALVAGLVFAVSTSIDLVRPVHDIPVEDVALCGTSDLMILVAQSVPEATSLPCIAGLPAGWSSEGTRVRNGRTRFVLESADSRDGDAGAGEVEVTLLPEGACDVTGASSVPTDELGMSRFERPEELPPHLRVTRTYLFPGGCTTYRFTFDDAPASLAFTADLALSFQPRAEVVAAVRERPGLDLCGAGVECPGGPPPEGLLAAAGSDAAGAGGSPVAGAGAAAGERPEGERRW